MRTGFFGRALGAVALALLSGGLAHAQVHRTFVSVSGNDANDCLNPGSACRTINAAITKVDANGEVIIVTTGSYAGANITKAVRINAPTGIVAFAAIPVTINAGASDVVVIRGFTVKALTPGVGTGFLINSAGQVTLERAVIDGWAVGVQVASANTTLVLSDSVVRNNTTGLETTVAAVDPKVSVLKTRFEKNGTGIAAAQAAAGEGKVAVARSTFSGNTTGLLVQTAGLETALDRCLISNNSGFGINVAFGSMMLSNSMVWKNGTGVNVSPGAIGESFGSSGIRGNITFQVNGTLTAVATQ
jgi:hypothetical protein